MTSRTLYMGYAISKISKDGRVKIPEAFGRVLSKNSGELRILIGQSFTENCCICYDTGIRLLEIDACRSLIYPRTIKGSEPAFDCDRSILSTLFQLDVSLGYSFKLPKALAGSFSDGDQIVFLSLGYAFEIWKIDDLLHSKRIHKNLATLIESERTQLH